jgi:SAM-dependent methyltransferase
MFEVAEAYEVMMGRWSRQLAPLFVDFAGVRDGETVLDVGCGTGSLSATLARVTEASKIVGIDASSGFVEYARTQNADPRVTFEVGDAQALPYPDESFDRFHGITHRQLYPRCSKGGERDAQSDAVRRYSCNDDVGRPCERTQWLLVEGRGRDRSDSETAC